MAIAEVTSTASLRQALAAFTATNAAAGLRTATSSNGEEAQPLPTRHGKRAAINSLDSTPPRPSKKPRKQPSKQAKADSVKTEEQKRASAQATDRALFTKLQAAEQKSVGQIESTFEVIQTALEQLRSNLSRVQSDSVQLRSALSQASAPGCHNEAAARLQSSLAATVRDAVGLVSKIKYDRATIDELKYSMDTMHQFHVDTVANLQSENMVDQVRLRNEVHRLRIYNQALQRRVDKQNDEVERQREDHTRFRTRLQGFFYAERARLRDQSDRWNAHYHSSIRIERDYIRSVLNIYQRRHEIGQVAVDSAVAALTMDDYAIPPTSIEASLEKVHIEIEPLTSVRVIASLPRDLLPLISSFLFSGSLDVAVTKKASHIVTLLLANGATVSPTTMHFAVKTADLRIVESVFRAGSEHITPHLLHSFSIQDERVAEWIVREYPAAMAHEYIRLYATLPLAPEDRIGWHTDRIDRQRQWEQEIEDECYQRKQTRLKALLDSTM